MSGPKQSFRSNYSYLIAGSSAVISCIVMLLVPYLISGEKSPDNSFNEKTFLLSERTVWFIFLVPAICFLMLGIIGIVLRREYISRMRIEKELTVSRENLQLQIEKLNASNKELEHFAYIASHDLEEPLRKISTFTGRIEEKLGTYPDEEVKNYLSRLTSASVRMRVLIQDLLNYSRATRSIDINETVALTPLFKSILDDLSVTIQAKNALVHIKPLEQVQGNPTQLRQLFQNILSNALKFNDKERAEISVWGKYYSDEELKKTSWGKNSTFGRQKYYCIFTEDNGIGFSPEYLSQIFVIFQRLHGRADYEGTGIGLAICKRIAEHHGGFITADSKTGKGATFIVGLPVT
jgi:light-regulated signal transduction histidine kinase (bacteriophytochrome)